jgi:predicted DNA-binding WGR domain protein
MTENKFDSVYLELSDGISHKFYEMTIQHNCLTTRFGRIGTQGAVNTQEFDDIEDARKEMNKIFNAKLKKGYEIASKGEKPKKEIPKRPKLSLEEQLARLQDCNIALSPGINPELLLTFFDRKEYEKKQFELLLYALGEQTVEDIPRYISPNIWHFDWECVYDGDAYLEITNRLKTLASDALPIENVTASIDLEASEGSMTFELNGVTYRWDIKVEEDWADPGVFEKFDELLISISNLRYFFLDEGDDDLVIGCGTEEQLRQLREVTGLKFDWLCTY